MRELVRLLADKGLKISCMESCTGGGVCNAITNVEGASEVFEFGAVTYSNAFKVKLGVDAEVIERYSVYSEETAKEMSRAVREFSRADIGIGVTGKLRRIDKHNAYGDDDAVFISVFNGCNYYIAKLNVIYSTREDNKKQIIQEIVNLIKRLI